MVKRSLSSSSSNTEDNEEEGVSPPPPPSSSSSSSTITEKDSMEALLRSLEETPEIACRYTEEDAEFAAEISSVLRPPPIVTNWVGPRPFRGGGFGRGGYQRYQNQGGRRDWEGDRDEDRRRGGRERYSDDRGNSRKRRFEEDDVDGARGGQRSDHNQTSPSKRDKHN